MMAVSLVAYPAWLCWCRDRRHGAGHVPAALVVPIEALARKMPIVLASRVPGDPIFSGTYGFSGSEIDLIERGVTPPVRCGRIKRACCWRFVWDPGSTKQQLVAYSGRSDNSLTGLKARESGFETLRRADPHHPETYEFSR